MRDAPVVAELVDEADVVYHLAAAVGVELIVESPVRTIETNVHCTEVVLAAANKKKKPVFVASTSEVYGKSTALPFQEDGDLLLGPTFKGRWSYACSKAIDEFLALAYWKERGLPDGHRPAVQHGRPAPDRALRDGGPELRAPGARGEPITVFGDGKQSRCFCHVDDVVRALADLMERDELYGEVFNIGSTEESRSAISPSRCVDLCGSSSDRLVPYDEAYEEGFEDMQRRVPDISKIQRCSAGSPRGTRRDPPRREGAAARVQSAQCCRRLTR